MKWTRASWTGLLVLGLWMTVQHGPRRAFEPSIGRRLLGPVAELAAAWQWVRVRVALDAGRADLAFSRAEKALDLDPAATAGWTFLASTLAFDRASPDREREPRLRQRWTEVALDLLERGEAVAHHPAELALQRGMILVNVGDSAGAIPWPGGAPAAWQQAQLAFEAAARLDPGASEPWAHLAANLCLRLGSPTIEPKFAGRKDALRQALDCLDRGLAVTRAPAPLHFQRGMLLGFIAESPDGPRWPGGRAQLYADAIEAFQLAEQEGFPLARVARKGAQEALAQDAGD